MGDEYYGAGPRRPQVPRSGAFLHRPQPDLARAAQGVWQLEQCVETVLAAQPVGRVRGVLRAPCRDEQDGAPSADVRQHRGARACLGRSRGGFSCKIHLKTEFDDLPIAFHLTGSEVSDCTQLDTSLDIRPNITPRAALTDNGYDAKANRAACRQRGILRSIPHRSNAKDRPAFFPKTLHKARARIEQTMGKLKRVAFRCEKTDESYDAIVAFACSMILVKSVHTA